MGSELPFMEDVGLVQTLMWQSWFHMVHAGSLHIMSCVSAVLLHGSRTRTEKTLT